MSKGRTERGWNGAQWIRHAVCDVIALGFATIALFAIAGAALAFRLGGGS